jgi:ATP-binding cassette subfamily C protein CydCD
VAVLLGAGSWLAGTLLTGAAAWLLVKASGRPPVLSLSIAVVTVRGSAVARPLLRYLERLVSHEVGFARMAGWRAEVYAGLVVRKSGPVPRRRGELLTRIGQDVDLRVDGLLRGTLPAAAAGLTLAVATLAAAGVAPMAGAVLAAGLLLSALVAPALAARWAIRADDQDDRARAELSDAVVETVDALEELAARGPSSLDLPRRRARQLAAVQARSALTAGAAAALSHLGLGAAVTAVAAVLATGSARPGPELAAAVLLGVLTLTEPVLALPDAAIARRRAAAARTRLAGPVIEQSVVPGGATNCLITAGKGVEVRGLTAGWGQSVLRDLDLTLPAGGRVAVLGTSGAGKSTLAAVLARRLAPSAGTVAGPERVGLVGDGLDHVFATTLRQNLLLARPEASDPELTDVLHQVELGSWLRNQPDGLDTWLGAGATTISGGEQRRLATARALLADPDLLVLDEPTEGLDEPTAQALMADLLPAGRGRSVILLAHRHEGLDRMDAVLELAGGRLRTVVPPVTPLARRIRPNQSRAATGSASGTNQ